MEVKNTLLFLFLICIFLDIKDLVWKFFNATIYKIILEIKHQEGSKNYDISFLLLLFK